MVLISLYFNNRVSGLVNYYIKDTADLLQSVPLSLTTGHSSYTQNVGEVRNQGIEIELDATVIKLVISAGQFMVTMLLMTMKY